MTIGSGMVNPLLQRALKMRKRLCRTPKSQRLADVIPSLLTDLALETWEANLEGYSVPDPKVGDCGANCCDNARGFMAKGKRFLDDNITVAVVIKVVQVGTAETRSFDCDLNF
jgi:hypothetical protein